MKFEPKIEFKETSILKECIDKTFFDNTFGRIGSKKEPIILYNEDPSFIIFKGWNNNLVKLTNSELINGSLRVVIEEYGDRIHIVPISTYCFIENEKYNFF